MLSNYGQHFYIKDGSGNLANCQTQLESTNSNTINGSSSFLLNGTMESIHFVSLSDGTSGNVVSVDTIANTSIICTIQYVSQGSQIRQDTNYSNNYYFPMMANYHVYLLENTLSTSMSKSYLYFPSKTDTREWK